MPSASPRFTASQLAVLAILFAVICFALAPTTSARFSRAPRIISVGSNWGEGYVLIPQRIAGTSNDRKALADRAALLAREHGLAIVADVDARNLSVIHKERNKK